MPEEEKCQMIIEMVNTIKTISKLAGDYLLFQQTANSHLLGKFGRGRISTMGVPIDDIVKTTDKWLRNYEKRV